MAEQKQQEKKHDKAVADKKEKDAAAKKRPEPLLAEALIRIFGYDLPAGKAIFVALTKVKGVSWAISNAACLQAGIPHKKKVQELSKTEIAHLEDTLRNIQIPDYMKNRRSDPETGKTSHLYGTDLEIAKDFDIKRMKKMKSYKGIRHTAKLPVRGQRTRSHFRTRGKNSTGIIAKKKAVAAAPAPAGKAAGGKAAGGKK